MLIFPQWETYSQLSNPQNAHLLESSIALAGRIRPKFPDVTFEELAVEIGVHIRSTA